MLATKTNAKEKSVTSSKPESKKGVVEEAAPQIQLNPLWHSLATHVGNNAAAGAGDPSPIQRKPSYPTSVPHIQRMCAECDGDEELNTDAETPIQTKLTVGAPDDQYEKEADAVADKVMRMPVVGGQEDYQGEVPNIQGKRPAVSPIQRMCSDCKKEKNSDTPSLQKKSIQSFGHSQKNAPDSVMNAIKSPGSGSPLSESIRARVEPVVRADLSSVRVHTDSQSQLASRNIQAKAFTNGNHVFLGAGQSHHDVKLMAHEATHTVQQGGASTVTNDSGQKAKPNVSNPIITAASGVKNTVVQRDSEENSNSDIQTLSSPLFKGEPQLEKCIRGELVLRSGEKGVAVEKLQTALISLGHKLPVFGPDKNYGAETARAVRAFQSESGLSGKDVDGKVGHQTLYLLDMATRHGALLIDPDKQDNDFSVLGKYKKAADHPMTIFFNYNEWDALKLDAEETAKIQAAAKKFKTIGLTLEGYASEEGSVKSNDTLLKKRIESVGLQLYSNGHEGLQVFDPRPNYGVGDVNYRKLRSVKIVSDGSKSTPTKTGATKQACKEETEKAIEKAAKLADELIKAAEEKLPLTKKDKNTLFDKLFGTDDRNRIATAVKVKEIMGKMRKHIKKIPNKDAHYCATTVDPTCSGDAVAYNSEEKTKKNKNPAGVTVLCPVITESKSADVGVLAVVLVHEGHHGTPDIESDDFAYNYGRIFFHLKPEMALKNASSFHAFILHSAGKESKKTGHSATLLGPKVLDEYKGALGEKGAEDKRQIIDETVGWLQHWVGYAQYDLARAFAAVKNARNENSWPSSDGTEIIKFMAPRFGLTNPKTKLIPSVHDQKAVAAVYDRIFSMKQALNSPLSFRMTKTSATSWSRGPGAVVMISERFFFLKPNQQASVLLQELIGSTVGISAPLEVHYFDLIDGLQLGHGWPGPGS